MYKGGVWPKKRQRQRERQRQWQRQIQTGETNWNLLSPLILARKSPSSLFCTEQNQEIYDPLCYNFTFWKEERDDLTLFWYQIAQEVGIRVYSYWTSHLPAQEKTPLWPDLDRMLQVRFDSFAVPAKTGEKILEKKKKWVNIYQQIWGFFSIHGKRIKCRTDISTANAKYLK